jgi:hypothetical protein
MAKKNNNAKDKITERRTLAIHNHGDTVVIKSRSAVGGGMLGAIIMIFAVVLLLNMKEAWSSPAFWCVFAFIFLCSAYWFANTVFNKIILNSPKKTLTVYGPFKKEYSFDDVNYVEIRTSKPKGGTQAHTVCVYIGNGRRSVRIDTLSSAEAKEVESLFKGMLDSGAMEFPEGNEERFEPQVKKKLGGALFGRTKRTEEKKSAPEVDEPISFVTKNSIAPERSETVRQLSESDRELDQYEAHLIRKNKK